jgi:hypothetical protein
LEREIIDGPTEGPWGVMTLVLPIPVELLRFFERMPKSDGR